ncbi:hypothetical protein [Pandoraea oxalativorans]|uniref:Uncharacterized protein n=1 Tax=Pandoraea oxalativorans TaxID=573737 RepID=A0A0G3IJ48_9BURK|nr:hypothetical protein [Pandoraea oxalativorans]AKK25125.1 hypothetical protein MB84_30885 [Pandoraea oxalativorans]
MKAPTLIVIRYKTLLMQRLLDLVRHGYRHHTAGTVKADRAEALCVKFGERYDVFVNMNQRAYRKTLGKANARLILADLDHGESLHWFLMVTDGEHDAHKLEKLKDALSQGERVHVSGYELLKLPHAKAAGGGVRLTWRMCAETERAWRFQIRSTVRSKRADELVPVLAKSLYQTPGFHTTRVQVGRLVAFLTAEWVRSGRKADALALPGALPYVRRMADENFTLYDWLAAGAARPNRGDK